MWGDTSFGVGGRFTKAYQDGGAPTLHCCMVSCDLQSHDQVTPHTQILSTIIHASHSMELKYKNVGEHGPYQNRLRLKPKDVESGNGLSWYLGAWFFLKRGETVYVAPPVYIITNYLLKVHDYSYAYSNDPTLPRYIGTEATNQ